MEQFHTQQDVALCGLTSLCMVLNALEIDPNKEWKYPWRWWSEELLESQVPLEIIKKHGVTVQEFYHLAVCNGLAVECWNGETTDWDTFRRHVKQVTLEEYRAETGDEVFMVCSFSRKHLGQTGDGHYAAVAAFVPGDETPGSIAVDDKVLLLDTAKFKYPSFFVSLRELHESMSIQDNITGSPRGYFLLRRHSKNESTTQKQSGSSG